MDAPVSAGPVAGPPYKAKAIANYFLAKAEGEHKPLTPMKLQKLIYFAHGWHLALVSKPLIDERVQAWEFGPVIRTVYDEFKQFGSAPITGRASSLEVVNGRILSFEPTIAPSDGQTVEFLDRIWDVYKPLSAFQLSALTHQGGTPWEKTYPQNRGVRNLTIEDTIIREFFVSQAQANRERKSA